MEGKTRFNWLIGGLAAIGFLVGVQQDIFWLRMLCKPIPVVCMALWLLPRRGEAYARWLLLGLLFSLAGDVLLEIPRNLFIAGLIAFLLAHLCYILAYLQDSRALAPLRALPCLVYGVALCGLLFVDGHMKPGLKLPVAVYALVICSMLWRAAARFGVAGIGRFSVQAAMWGAILFALSDSMIAINKFYAPFGAARYAIIVTYWAGQLGIVASVLQRQDTA